MPPLNESWQGGAEPIDPHPRCSFEACCFDFGLSVTSDIEGMVPTGRRADSL